MRTQPEEAPVIFMINHYHYLKNIFFPAVGEIFIYLFIYNISHFFVLVKGGSNTFLFYFSFSPAPKFLCFGRKKKQYIPKNVVLRSKEKPIHSKLQFLFGRQLSPVAVTTFPEDFPDFFNVLAKPTHTYVGSQFGHCEIQMSSMCNMPNIRPKYVQYLPKICLGQTHPHLRWPPFGPKL